LKWNERRKWNTAEVKWSHDKHCDSVNMQVSKLEHQEQSSCDSHVSFFVRCEHIRSQLPFGEQ
jgi:hypothetical protein